MMVRTAVLFPSRPATDEELRRTGMNKAGRALIRKNRRPTEFQTRVLGRIAQTGRLMLTHQESKPDSYADGAGSTIDERTAKILIRNGWVVAERDGMFDLAPRSWRAKGPV